MKRLSARVLMVCSVGAVAGLTAQPAAADTGRIHAYADANTGRAIAAVTLNVAEGSQAASAQVFLAADGGSDVSDVKLEGSVDGPGNLHLDATIAAPTVTVPHGHGRLPVTITVAGLTRPGTYKGTLLSIVANSASQVATLTISKQDDPDLVVDGVGADGSLILNTPTGDLRGRINLRSTSGTAVRNVQASVTAALDPNGLAHDLMFANNASTINIAQIKPHATLPLDVTGLAPVEGDYSAMLTLIWDAKSSIIKLTIHRIRLAPAVSIDEISTPSVGALPFSHFSVYLRVVVHETQGEPVTLRPPQILDMLRDERGVNLSGGFKTPQILDEHGSAIASIALAANDTRVFLVRLDGLSDPGKYDGTVRLPSGDGPGVDHTWTAYLHWDQWVTGVLIALGAGVAAALRYWLLPDADRRKRKWLLGDLRTRLAKAVKAFGTLSAPEQHAYADLDLAILHTKDLSPDGVDRWHRMLEVFTNWLVVGRMAGDSGEPLPRHAAEAFVNVTKAFRDDVTEASVIASESNMRTAQEAAIARFAGALAERVAALADRATALAPHSGQFETRLTAIATEAKQLALSVKAPNADLRHAASGYEDLRGRLVEIFDEQLKQVIDTNAPPIGVSPRKWRGLRDRLARHREAAAEAGLTSEAGVKEIDQAELELARVLADGVKSAADTAAAGAVANQARELSVLGKTVSMHHAELRAGSRSHLELFAGSSQLLTALRGTAPGARAPHEVVDLPPGPLPAGLGLPVFDIPSPDDTARTSTWKLLALWLVEASASLVIITLLSVLSGILLLWSASWGGWWDAIIAVLWGSGLYQVAEGSKFGGLASVRDEIAGKTGSNQQG